MINKFYHFPREKNYYLSLIHNFNVNRITILMILLYPAFMRDHVAQLNVDAIDVLNIAAALALYNAQSVYGVNARIVVYLRMVGINVHVGLNA